MSIMEQRANRFLRTRGLVICCTCLFSAGLAWPQMISTQVHASVGNAAVGSRVNAASRSAVSEVRESSGQRVSGVQVATAGIGNQRRAAVSSGGAMNIGMEARKSFARSGTGASMAGVRVASVSAGGAGASSGQFPDTTKEMFWPSPPLYQKSKSFSFHPTLPVWSPNFGETNQLNPNYMVRVPQIGTHKSKGWNGTGLQTGEHLLDPLSHLNAQINSGLNPRLPESQFSDPLKDPLAPGN